ncbi:MULTISPECIES: ParD-like family protein [Erwiniaceae]|uniref:ParD-like family protein n=1 Tax=Erwiniaceae TaxID=1903409 RepID=UPI001F4FA528|nr:MULTISPECIES: ParD-like family protein [Erwiniaceae]WKX25987.1 ParD-like family protein [Tatumella ptyseos]
MATSIRLDDDFVESIKIHAGVAKRSVPKQIEHWASIGKILEENPDLTYEFVMETLLAKQELEHSLGTRYVRRTKRT